jgi:hypothetical protein
MALRLVVYFVRRMLDRKKSWSERDADHVILCRKICQTALAPTIIKAILSCSPKRCSAAFQPKKPCSPSCTPAARIRTNVKKSISPLIIALAPDERKETPVCGVPGSPCYAEAQPFPRPRIVRGNCLPNCEADPWLMGRGFATALSRIGYNRRMKNGDINSDWVPYALAATISVIIAIGLWRFGLWGDEHAGDNWANFQASVVKALSHVIERPSRPTPSTTGAIIKRNDEP